MPIYAYRCESCGYAQDVLQKISDPLLTVCPACSAASFSKQITAAGFQLKGTGWYATDFRGGGKPASAASASSTGSKPTGDGNTSGAGDSKSAEGTSASAASAGAAPTTGSGDAGSKQ